MTEMDSPKSTANPLRWVLFVIVTVITVLAIFAARRVTDQMNTTSSRLPTRNVPSAPEGTICEVSPDVSLEARTDVRIQAPQGEGLRIARRTTADVDERGLHLPAGTPFGTGTISLGNAAYATFEFSERGCTTVVHRPPEPAVAPDEDTQ